MPIKRTQPWAFCALIAVASTLAAISANEMDDFEDGTTESWGHGSATGLVTNVADGGPMGAGDSFLRVESTGAVGPGGRLAVFNDMQWAGDYEAIGSEFTISVDLMNLGATPLAIRIGVEAPTVPTAVGEGGTQGVGDRWVTTTAFPLPAATATEGTGSGWQNALFTLSEAEMTQVAGSDPLSTTLSNVIQLRIISAASPAWEGDQIVGVVGIDNINVVSVPVGLQSFSVE